MSCSCLNFKTYKSILEKKSWHLEFVNVNSKIKFEDDSCFQKQSNWRFTFRLWSIFIHCVKGSYFGKNCLFYVWKCVECMRMCDTKWGTVVYVNVNVYMYVYVKVCMCVAVHNPQFKSKKAERTKKLRFESLQLNPSLVFLVFLWTLIKKDGEAWGLRSSNESMFMHFTQGKWLQGELSCSLLPPNLLLSWCMALIKQYLTFQQSLLLIAHFCVPLLQLYKDTNYDRLKWKAAR